MHLSKRELEALRKGEPFKKGEVKPPPKPHPMAGSSRVKLMPWSASRYWRRKRKPKVRIVWRELDNGRRIPLRRKRYDYVHGR